MRTDHLFLLACPRCKKKLEISRIAEREGDKIKSGALMCPGCNAHFPIRDFITRFVRQENYADSFGLEWGKHARTLCDSYNGTNASEERFFNETKWPRKMHDQVILEVGCGSGRFTEQAASTGATIVSFDYSSAVEDNYKLNGKRKNVLIIQADIYSMPFEDETFDRIFAFGVLQHTPNVKKAFKSLLGPLKTGGRIAIDVYPKYRGVKEIIRLSATKCWLRPFTKRLPRELLYTLCKNYVQMMWPLGKLIHRLPRIGRHLNWRLLITEHIDEYPLSKEHLLEWAILHCFDLLSPSYDNPQPIEAVNSWFIEGGCKNIEVQYGYNGIQARAEKARAPTISQNS